MSCVLARGFGVLAFTHNMSENKSKPSTPKGKNQGKKTPTQSPSQPKTKTPTQSPKNNKRKLDQIEIPDEDTVPAYTTPPHREELNFKTKTLTVYVTLHKIPDKFIVLNVTEDEFFLNTLNFTKKLYLKYIF